MPARSVWVLERANGLVPLRLAVIPSGPAAFRFDFAIHFMALNVLFFPKLVASFQKRQSLSRCVALCRGQSKCMYV